MRFAQITLVAAVVIVGFLGYTIPGHRILNDSRTSQRLQARLQLRELPRSSKAASVGGFSCFSPDTL